ncbi:hypothetical protein HYX14_02915 [Candidatus Woesearchaeota archaeon]|nr:hypothetical protein [Candidatus Woesearchaeota archaeon]
MDYEYLAKKSEGYSFRELERCWNMLMYHYLEDKTELTSAVLRGLLKDNALEEKMAYG